MSRITKQKAFVLKKGQGRDALDVFHTWRCRCEGVGRDLGCGHEDSHLMHETKHSI